jgi:hypothetical protein
MPDIKAPGSHISQASLIHKERLATWLGSVWKDRIVRTETLLGQIDTDLRQRRIEVYKELWESTALLPKWAKDESVTYEVEIIKGCALSERFAYEAV